jgi:hypothetical protein
MLKAWFVLKENNIYSAKYLMDISINTISKKMFNEPIRDNWVKEGSNYNVKFTFNETFLYKLEKLLIDNGIYFSWIEDDDNIIGIFIEPTNIDLNAWIYDCMTIDEYARNRKKEFSELMERKKDYEDYG